MFGTNCNFNLLYCAGNAVQPFVLAFLWKCTTVQSTKGRNGGGGGGSRGLRKEQVLASRRRMQEKKWHPNEKDLVRSPLLGLPNLFPIAIYI
jgi:hypothetical protein